MTTTTIVNVEKSGVKLRRSKHGPRKGMEVIPQLWQLVMLSVPFMYCYDNVMGLLCSSVVVQMVIVVHLVCFVLRRKLFDDLYRIYLPFLVSFTFCDRTLTELNMIMSTTAVIPSNYTPIHLVGLIFQAGLMKIGMHNYDYISGVKCLVANYLLVNWLEDIGQLKSLDQIDCNLFGILLTDCLMINNAKAPNYLLVLKGAMTSVMIIIVVNHFLTRLIPSLSNSIVLAGNFLVLFPILVNHLIDFSNEKITSPALWLIDYILESEIRQYIMLSWVIVLVVFIPLVILFKSKISLNTSRKIWHFVIFLLIVEPFHLDPEFVKISLCGIIPCFLSVEYLRYLKIEPYGEHLDFFLTSFADYRDQRGPLIVSYIYLITGITIPLLLFESPVGLVSLGVGDSLASIVGKKVGRMHWKGTNKTIEGTVAFIVGTTFISWILQRYFNYFSTIDIFKILVICTTGGVLEGNSELNDNILIPLFMVSMEKLLAQS
ncbi:hypothetical protein J7297_05020 [Nakaseomyces glabratus]|nr:hypothetical protein J7297_05020 [Nakaseomyces glabratus]KAH7580244.1 hypothetical protein J7296_04997 [Nakaseomyces glabratus]